jgi:hypothetical protein
MAAHDQFPPVMQAPCGTQMGSGIPNEDRSQQSLPVKQSFGLSEQPCTRQVCETNVSQYVASVPAQSSGVVQALPKPLGGRSQMALLLQA